MGKAASAAQKRGLGTAVSQGEKAPGTGRGRVGEVVLEAWPFGLTLLFPVFTAPAESEGSGPEEKSPGQQVCLELAWNPQTRVGRNVTYGH